MISLTQVEEQVRRVLGQPELELVAVSLPDEKKGERVVLLLAADIDGDAVRKALIEARTNPLIIRAEFRQVPAVPKLGSGKTDFKGARELVMAG